MRWQRWLPAVLILLLAAGIRFVTLDTQSLWNDEGNSARLSERSLRLILEGTASDVHPPAYYLFLAVSQRLLGRSEFALRSLSAFAGVLSVAATVTLGRSFFQRRAGLLAGLLVALSPPLVYYSQEARMYSLLGLWTVLSWLAWRHLLPRGKQRPFPTLPLIGYIFLTALGLYTHYVYPAILASQLVAWGSLWAWRRWQAVSPSRLWLIPIGAALGLCLYLPWLPIFLRTGSGGRIAAARPFGDFLASALRWLALGSYPGQQTFPLPESSWVTWGAVLLWLAALAFLAMRKSELSVVLGLGIAVPLLGMQLVGTTLESYFKFLTGLVPLLWLGTAVGVWEAAQRFTNRNKRSVALLLTLLLGLPLAQTHVRLQTDPTTFRADYRAIAAEIQAANIQNPAILLNAPNQWEVFTYYYSGEAEVYPVARTRPDAASAAAELAPIADKHDRIYALFWGEAERDPERHIERWLDANAFKATDTYRGDVRFVTYAVPSAAATQIETQLDLPVGEELRLQGFTLAQAALTPGSIVEVTLFWEAERPLDTRYKIFLHLIDPALGLEPLAQRDSEPVGNLKPTNTWTRGEQVIDKHGLLVPSNLPAGGYQLLLGVYALQDPDRRLPFMIQDGETDIFPLADIVVTEP